MNNSKTTKKNQTGIYVESKPVTATQKIPLNFTKYGNSDHLLLVYRDENGNEQIIRGGPQNNKDMTSAVFNNVPIEMEKSTPRQTSRDKYGDGTEPSTRNLRKLNIPEGLEREYWDNMNKSANKIDNLGIEYKNPPNMKNIQNSNSAIRTVLQESCFIPERNIPERNIPEAVRNSVPGYETDLLNNPKLSKRVDIDNPDMPRLMDEQEQQQKLEKLRNQDRERKLFEEFNNNSNSYQDLLLKKDQDITENEVKDATKYSRFEAKDPEIKKNLDSKVSGWYSAMYGDSPSKTDATGRNIEPQAKSYMPAEPKSLLSKDGLGIADGFKRLAPQISQREDGVNALQRGINELGYKPELKEDGIFGPKTTFGVKNAMVNSGIGELEKKLKPNSSALQNKSSLI